MAILGFREGEYYGVNDNSPVKDPKSYMLTLESISRSGFLSEGLEAGAKSLLPTLKTNDFKNNYINYLVLKNNGLFIQARQRGVEMYPAGAAPVPTVNYIQSLAFKGEYNNFREKSVEFIQKNRGYQDENFLPVKVPDGEHHIIRKVDGYCYYVDKNLKLISGLNRFGANDGNLDEEYKFPKAVKAYQFFNEKEGAISVLFEGRGYRNSIFEYIYSLGKAVDEGRLHPLICAYQQKMLLSFVVSQPISVQAGFGVPTKEVANELKQRFDKLNLSGLGPETWFVDPEFNKDNSDVLKKLEELIEYTQGFKIFRAELIKSCLVECNLAGFVYEGNLNYFKTVDPACRLVFYNKNGFIRIVDEKGDLAPTDLENPQEFSPLYEVKFTKTSSVSESELTRYPYLNQLPSLYLAEFEEKLQINE